MEKVLEKPLQVFPQKGGKASAQRAFEHKKKIGKEKKVTGGLPKRLKFQTEVG